MILSGTLHKTDSHWIVRHPKYPASNKIFDWQDTKLVPEDQNRIILSPTPMEGTTVTFQIVDEFTNPEYYRNVGWGDGVKLAKLSI